MSEGESRFATAGFAIADVWSWAQFVESGELARTLTHACLLVESRFQLAYRLTRTNGMLALAVTVGDETRSVFVAQPEPVEPAMPPMTPLTALVRAINEFLIEAGRSEQLVAVQLPLVRRRYRMLLVAPSDLAEVRELDYAKDCLVEPAPIASPAGMASLPSIPSIDERAERRFDVDGSLLGLVAAYVERLAVFAGLEGVTCQARYAQDPGVLTFSLSHQPPGSGGLLLTLKTRYMPQLDVQPILDDLNSMLHGTNKQRLYRIARAPDRIDVALLDKAAVAELRRAGDLIEHPARTALRALANAGFELPSLYGKWMHFGAFDLETILARFAVLADGIAAIAHELEVTDDYTVTITWTVNGRAATTKYPGELGERQKTDILAMMICDLDRQLAAAGCDYRFVAMSGEPYFHSHRVLLLDPEWLAIVADSVLPGCLDDAMRAPLVHVAGAFPAGEPSSVPPRLPRMVEIVRAENIQSNDFKCSARPSDYIDLIEQIARFARVAVEVSPTIARDGDEFLMTVTHRDTPATIRLENRKYADVTPILDYLNPLLEARTPVRQLYNFRGGGYAGGLVRATADEAARLRIAGYI